MGQTEQFWQSFEVVDELDDDDGDYNWHIVGVFQRNADGKLFWSSDSGCSCYGPWECITEEEIEPLTPSTWMRFRDDAVQTSKRGHEWAIEMGRLT